MSVYLCVHLPIYKSIHVSIFNLICFFSSLVPLPFPLSLSLSLYFLSHSSISSPLLPLPPSRTSLSSSYSQHISLIPGPAGFPSLHPPLKSPTPDPSLRLVGSWQHLLASVEFPLLYVAASGIGLIKRSSSKLGLSSASTAACHRTRVCRVE